MVLTKLKEKRLAANLTQEQLGVAAGMTGRSINRAESGKGVFLNNAKAIAKVLHVKPEDLL